MKAMYLFSKRSMAALVSAFTLNPSFETGTSRYGNIPVNPWGVNH